jgi:hypothetical protein
MSSDGSGLVRRLYGHPDEDRVRDRIALAFATVPEKPVAKPCKGRADRA